MDFLLILGLYIIKNLNLLNSLDFQPYYNLNL